MTSSIRAAVPEQFIRNDRRWLKTLKKLQTRKVTLTYELY